MLVMYHVLIVWRNPRKASVVVRIKFFFLHILVPYGVLSENQPSAIGSLMSNVFLFKVFGGK